MPEAAVAVTALSGIEPRLPWPETVGLVQAMAAAAAPDAWPGDLSAFRLTARGEIEISDSAEGRVATGREGAAGFHGSPVSSLASFLERLLPPPNEAVEPRVPAGLRYTLVRARGGVTAPPFQSLEEFSQSLARFEQGDRRAALERLARRVVTAAERLQPPAQQRERTVEAGPHARHVPARHPSMETRLRPSEVPAGRRPLKADRRPTEVSPEWRQVGRPPASEVPARHRPMEGPRASQVAEGHRSIEARPHATDVDAGPRRLDVSAAARPAELPASRRAVEGGVAVAQGTPAPAMEVAPPLRAPAGDTLIDSLTPAVQWDDVPLSHSTAARFDAAPGVAAAAWRGPVGLPTRRHAGPFLTAVAALSILIAAAVVAAAVVVTLDEQRSTAAPSGPQAPADGGWTDAQRPPSPAATAGAAGTPATPDTSGVLGTNAAAPTPAVPEATAGLAVPLLNREPRRAGEMIETLDAANRPVFSPAFAAYGSAIFIDQNEPIGAGAPENARSLDGGRVVQVLSVVADGARNYHPRLSPDGSQVAFDSDRDGVRGVYLSDRSGRNIRRVSGEGYAAVPAWSPDGKRLALLKAEPDNPRVWNIWLLTLATGEAVRVTSHRAGQPWGASWLPDGHRICYSHEDRLVVLDLDTHDAITYPSPKKGALPRTPSASPDGTRVIFLLNGDGAWLLDLRNGTMRRVLDDPTAEEFAWSPDGSRVAFHSRRDSRWGIWVLPSTS